MANPVAAIPAAIEAPPVKGAATKAAAPTAIVPMPTFFAVFFLLIFVLIFLYSPLNHLF